MKISKKKETKITKVLDTTIKTTEEVRDAVIKEAATVLEEEAKKNAKLTVEKQLENIDVDATIKNTIKENADLTIDKAAEEIDTEALLSGDVDETNFFTKMIQKFISLFKKNK